MCLSREKTRDQIQLHRGSYGKKFVAWKMLMSGKAL
jgi:hypothetical protein